jgi:hypothetical protein
MLKLSSPLIRIVSACIILLLSIAYAYYGGLKKVNAATNPSGLTGKYGCMVNRNVNGFGILYNSLDSSYTIGLVATAIFDYDRNTVSTLSGEIANYNKMDPLLKNFTSEGTFTETSIPTHSGAYKSTITLTDTVRQKTGTMTFISIPVNSGNTILITEISDNTSNAPWTGVCQKI